MPLLGLAAAVVSAAVLTACGDEQRSAGRPAVASVDPAPVVDQQPRTKDDAEAAESFPVADPLMLTERAPAPEAAKPAKVDAAASAADGISPGAPSDAQIKRQLREMEQALDSFESGSSGSAT